MTIDKTVASPAEAVADILSGSSLAVGGFGLCGNPMLLIEALLDKGIDDLRIVSNNCGVDDWGLGVLLAARRIAKMTSSYVGENKEFERQFLSGELEVELTPQGTLAEKLRADASLRVEGCKAITTDFSLVHAAAGDRHGNLVFSRSARNFSPLAAMAGRVCIAQVERLVEPGELDPDAIHLPGVYVSRVVEVGTDIEKRIEKRTVRAAEGGR